MARRDLRLPHASSHGRLREGGVSPVAYPVSFYTSGSGLDDLHPIFDPERNLRTFQLALHEWIGLAAYRASGRIDRLFPGPEDTE